MAKVNVAKGLLVLGWVIMQTLLYQQHGVKVVFDSHRFILFTNEIITNQPFTYPQVWRYLGYPIFLLPFFKAGLALKFVVWGQMAVSGFAAIALYKASKDLTKHEWIALATTALFIFFPDLQAWNCYILTDSLLTSFLTISLCLLVLPKTRLLWIAFAIAFLWTILVRPNGFIGVLASASFLNAKYKPFTRYNKWVLSLAGLLLGIGFYLVLDNFLLRAFTLMIPYERGDLIYGYYGIVLNKFYQPQIPPSTLSPLSQVFWFFWVNPVYFIGMALLKGFFFFIHVKPYYSLVHNLFILSCLLPVYYLAWVGWKKGEIHHTIKTLFLTPILLQLGITMLTIEDWDGRWLNHILPQAFLFASFGMLTLTKKRRTSLHGNPTAQ